LNDDETVITKPLGAEMSDMTSYMMSLDQTALGLYFVAVLGVIGCLAFGAMRTDIARARPEMTPIDHIAAATRQVVEAVARHGQLVSRDGRPRSA
jgi:hypothetical protein